MVYGPSWVPGARVMRGADYIPRHSPAPTLALLEIHFNGRPRYVPHGSGRCSNDQSAQTSTEPVGFGSALRRSELLPNAEVLKPVMATTRLLPLSPPSKTSDPKPTTSTVRSGRSSVSKSEDHRRQIFRSVRPDPRPVWRQKGDGSRFRPTTGQILVTGVLEGDGALWQM